MKLEKLQAWQGADTVYNTTCLQLLGDRAGTTASREHLKGWSSEATQGRTDVRSYKVMTSNDLPSDARHPMSTQKDYDHLVAKFPFDVCELQRALHSIHHFQHDAYDAETAQGQRLGKEIVSVHEQQACTREQGARPQPCPPIEEAQLFEFFGIAVGTASGMRDHERSQAKCHSADGEEASAREEADPDDLSSWDKHCLPAFLARRLGRAVDGSDFDGFQIHLDSLLESVDADARLSAVFAKLSPHRKSPPRVDID